MICLLKVGGLWIDSSILLLGTIEACCMGNVHYQGILRLFGNDYLAAIVPPGYFVVYMWTIKKHFGAKKLSGSFPFEARHTLSLSLSLISDSRLKL